MRVFQAATVNESEECTWPKRQHQALAPASTYDCNAEFGASIVSVDGEVAAEVNIVGSGLNPGDIIYLKKATVHQIFQVHLLVVAVQALQIEKQMLHFRTRISITLKASKPLPRFTGATAIALDSPVQSAECLSAFSLMF